MAVRLNIPSTINLFNNPAQRGAWLQTSEAMLAHLNKWPTFHRRVWEAVVQCCNGALESRRRKRAAQFQGKLAAIYGRTYSLENIQRAVADLVGWGFLVPVAGSVHAHSGRVYLLAGLDFPTPEGGAYLEERPHFRRRFKSRAKCQKIQSGSFSGGDSGADDLEPLEIVPVGPSPTADPPGAPLPIPGGREEGPRLPIPGGTDKARPDFLARPIPPTPTASKRSRRRSRRPSLGGGNFDQLAKAFRQAHRDARSPLTPNTIRRALENARANHPDLTAEQIAEKLIKLAGHVPDGTNHPILWAAKADWELALAPRPGAREFSSPAPAPVRITPEQLAKEREQAIRLGLISETVAPSEVNRVVKNSSNPAPEDAEQVAERQRVLRSLDRYDRAAWLEAQLAQL